MFRFLHSLLNATLVACVYALSLSAANAATLRYIAVLSGPNEAPPNASPGTGTATITIDTVAQTMRVQATFTGLTGNTTAAHIHCCTALPLLATAGVATTTPSFVGFPLGVTAGTMDTTFDMSFSGSFNAAYVTANGGTPGTAAAALYAGMAARTAYFNIHSSMFGGGEIRAFLLPINLDADDSITATKYAATTDGLLILRYLSGLTGLALTNGVLGGTAARTNPADIVDYLARIRPLLDIDGDSNVFPHTDGLLILRYMLGLRGEALIANVFTPGAPRNTAALIEAYLATLTP